jgi:pimeloyl-ACP methyl ester carboxylesterase
VSGASERSGLAYEVWPRTPGTDAVDVPLVLLHAFPLERSMWADTAAALGEATSVVLVDLPGMGASPLPDGGPPSLDASADGVAGVLDRLGHDRAVLAGVSMGGYVGMAFARRHPARLAGLALIDTKAAADTAQAAQKRERMAAAVTGEAGTRVLLPMLEVLLGGTSRARRPQLVNQVRDALLAAPAEGVAWSQRAMAARPDSTGTLATLRLPVTVVVGEEDSITGPLEAKAMAALVPGVVLVEVPAAGHLSPLERPDVVARALFDLLLRVQRS